jgi:predicted nucleic acid-binding protein
MALHLDHAVYDCVYLALAEQVRWQVITADRPFHDKVERSLFAGLTLWIEDLPP